jgi:hypothetical protein
MNQPGRGPDKEQRLLRNARREGKLIMAVWAAALVWSVGGSALFGYGRDADSIQLVLGMPDWIFWCVALPWVIALVFSGWFCFFFMADDDLGEDVEEGHGHG